MEAHDLNRVIVADCLPRLHVRRFDALMARLGLPARLLARANIREGAAWVRQEDAVAATAVARRELQMAVAGLRETPYHPFHPRLQESVARRVLVLGGGLAGMTAALTLADLGVACDLAEFATCICCQNCMRTCPICYCKECIFRTDVFDHPSVHYWDWAGRKGGVRLPSDTLLFHVTRMLHMAHACVGCGMCSDACPVGIPVADIFRAVGQAVQRRFDYVPGRDPVEEMVIATFREDELRELGEPGLPPR